MRWIVPALLLALVCSGSIRAQALQNPRRIAEGLHGQVLVTDRRFGAVVGVDAKSMEPVWSFPLPDEGAPFGVATWKRLLYVGNTKTMNVEVYRMMGFNDGPKLQFQYNLGHTTGLIRNPIDIAVSPLARRVFVLDGAEKQVMVFDRTGTLVDAFFPVDRDGELLSPVSIAVDEARREVLVGDYGDPGGSFRALRPARILIYSFGGELLFQIDGDGSTDPTTRFVRVQGMAASRDGRVFAAEPLAGRILVLDRTTGATIGEVGTPGDRAGELMLPLDVLIDRGSGDLFVSNNRGALRLEVFRGAARQR